ncbi:MAG: DUF3857 domain-containing protein [Ginsengibacter sp.]
MKLILLYCTLLFLISFSYAQEQIPEFGQFGGAELYIKECDFDKEADAIKLFDVAYGSYNDSYNLITTRRIRFKILKEKGINEANIEIHYVSKDDFESITSVRGITYTRAGTGEISLKELDKKAVFRQKLNERFSVLKFTLPNVKVGTIVDYEYTTTAKNYNGLDDWYFQSDMPTVLSRYHLTMIPTAEFAYVVHKSSDIPVKISSDKSSGSTMFEMKNIGGLRYEPFMDAAKNYLHYVEFQYSGSLSRSGSKINYMTTWKESARELLSGDYFGRQIERKLSGSDEIIAKANTFSTSYDKIKFIYEYVKNSFSWNNINSKFANDGINDVWANKKGTSGEINIVLINLLKQAGLQVDPMLVSERDHGKVNTDYPIIDQFNKVVAYVQTDNKKFILDATSNYTPVNIIPFEVLNTNAFIVNNKKPEVIKLTEAKSSSNFINIYSNISKDGMVNGYTTINSFNYAKVERLEDYMKSKEKFQHDYFEKDYAEINIDSLVLSNTETDSLGLQQQFKFTMPATVSGDYKLVNVNLFSGLVKNPFTLENRFSNVDFGCTRKTDINAVFEFPDDMKPEEMPKNVQLVTPDKSIKFLRIASLTDNTITIQISLTINQTVFTAEEYPMLKEFYKKMHNFLSEQIVLANK